MSNEIAVKNDINHQHDLSVIEQVVMQGDLSKLNPTQRVTYYHNVCKSVGLNPYTRPFEYISLNGKLTLYAKKDATEQLRQVKKISITALDGRIVDDLYIVVAKACTPDGRTDESTGAVFVGTLKGEQKANAIMKAETKAKRRVTLSISGMGWTDESEIESIPNAKKVDVDIETGEISNTNLLSLSTDSVEKSDARVVIEPKIQTQSPVVECATVQKHPGYEHFSSICLLKYGKNFSDYIQEILNNKPTWSDVKIINYAIENEASFREKIEKWIQKRKETVNLQSPVEGTI